METNFDPKFMSEKECLEWKDDIRKLPDWVLTKSLRPLHDQIVEDQARVKAGRKMEYIDLLHSGKVVGGTNYIRKSNEVDCINRHDAYLLCKQLITALKVGRFCNIDADDVEWAMNLVELRLGGHAKHLSKESI